MLIEALEMKKGENIVLLDLKDFSDFTDYFIICSATSDRMIDALADEVIHKAKKELRMKSQPEGLPRNGWVLIDLGDIVVHILTPKQREFYDLESLWSDAKVLVHLQ